MRLSLFQLKLKIFSHLHSLDQFVFTLHFFELHAEQDGTCHLSPLQTAAGGNKTEGSNTMCSMSTSFALKFWSNKIIDVDIILFIRLTVSNKLLIRFYSVQNLR